MAPPPLWLWYVIIACHLVLLGMCIATPRQWPNALLSVANIGACLVFISLQRSRRNG